MNKSNVITTFVLPGVVETTASATGPDNNYELRNVK
jgi:hypothetical protein